ncbi:M50 family metallopeptidase [Sphingomonas sp. LB-2]|uniref:M50 family metallopeptidase n=1 Tax=Sphingomonas caeni TaxID=2984949 RepID=UPI00222E706F|nr:M50 family metallopeptidase [Sphingomonas caeni]MCW3849133.1 M50 family metallopeptidase [Sphingomonas caeni]
MIQSPGILLTLLAFAIVIGSLVTLHELGHYLAGRWFGVKAEAFSFGFGREIAGFTDRRGTRWKLSMLPLGGYVRFAGDMNPASQPDPEWMSLPPEERAQTFQAKPLWQRAIIVAAGPIANFLIAIVILGTFAAIYGDATVPPVVGSVVQGSAADKAGLKSGDRITAMGGRAVDGFNDMAAFTAVRAGAPVRIDYVRDGQSASAETVIGTDLFKDRFGNQVRRGLLGIGPSTQVIRTPVAWWQAPWAGVERTWNILGMMVDGLGQMIMGRVPVNELGGPLRIAKMSGESLALGPDEFIGFIALISINLGFINLLPVPVADGGHLLFYGIEAIRRRPIEPRVMNLAFNGGLLAILALFLLVTINDLGAFGVWRNLAGLIG